ncbi:hypothetical protein C4573_01770 [Candidatus Woesearchaeota archaeon]|nr:MAG: hypothetical protein C4573_01770 [Candidatus Woesearchaeota archaeon]
MFTLDQIIQICDEQIGHNGDHAYREFLLRQIEMHPEYDLGYRRPNGKASGLTAYPWANVLIDKTRIFSYLLGDIPIATAEGKKRIGRDKHGNPKTIDKRAEDLTLLSQKSMGINTSYKENRHDHKLLTVYRRLMSRRYSVNFGHANFQNWQNIIDEIGKDPAIVAYFGRAISYADVSQHNKGERGSYKKQ